MHDRLESGPGGNGGGQVTDVGALMDALGTSGVDLVVRSLLLSSSSSLFLSSIGKNTDGEGKGIIGRGRSFETTSTRIDGGEDEGYEKFD